MLHKQVGLTTGTGLRHRLRSIHCDAITWPVLLTGVFCLLSFFSRQRWGRRKHLGNSN